MLRSARWKSSDFFNIDLASFTTASVFPLLCGQYGDEVACSKQYVVAKFWYSFEINCGPLSVRQRSGMPCRAKWALVRWMTVVAKVFGR